MIGKLAGSALVIAALGGGATPARVHGLGSDAGISSTPPEARAPPAELRPPVVMGPLPAFPGAEGYGALAQGGRGGRVYLVTNTSDSGAGSLRACAEAAGPRVCVFRVGGTIVLSSPIRVTNPYLTIAGQTAPGGGIQLRADGSTMAVLGLSTHDVVVRYVRARPGKGAERRQQDAITIGRAAENVILDHVTAMFGNDEQIGGGVAASRPSHFIRNVTVQYSLIGNVLASHPTGNLISGPRGTIRNISIHHNLYANAGYRTPLVGTSERVEAISNVVYNWPGKGPMATNSAQMDLIATYFRPGPATSVRGQHNLLQLNTPQADMSLFVSGLVAERTKPDASSDDWAFVRNRDGSGASRSFRRSTPHSRGSSPAPIPVTVSDARSAYRRLVLEGDVGAWQQLTCDGRWQNARDALDERTINDVKNGTRGGQRVGGYGADESGYGGFPTLARGAACADADVDGMPDSFESRYGLNPRDASDAWKDADRDRYANLEEYLNGTTPR